MSKCRMEKQFVRTIGVKRKTTMEAGPDTLFSKVDNFENRKQGYDFHTDNRILTTSAENMLTQPA